MGYEREMDYVYLDSITVRTGILNSKFWKLMERVNAVQLKKKKKICVSVQNLLSGCETKIVSQICNKLLKINHSSWWKKCIQKQNLSKKPNLLVV